MSELTGLGAVLLSELLSDAPEVLRTITYRQGVTDTANIQAIPDSLKFGEADGQFIKVTDTVWLIFVHQLSVIPQPDDYVIHDGISHYVVSAQAEDPARVLWRVITRG